MKQKFSIIAVAFILWILFSVVVFVLPIPKTGVFWLSYVFAVLAVVAQAGFVFVSFHSSTTARSKFYGYPVFRIGLIYLGVQFAMSLVFMLIGKWVPLWIPFLLYVVALGLAGIGLIAADNVRDTVLSTEERQAESTYMMRMLRRNAEAMQVTFPELKEFAEQLRYSDPVSTHASENLEQQLQNMLAVYQNQPDQTSRVRMKNQMMDILAQRNVVCKSSKTR